MWHIIRGLTSCKTENIVLCTDFIGNSYNSNIILSECQNNC